MSFQATAELTAKPPYNLEMGCLYFPSYGDSVSSITMYASTTTANINNTYMVTTSFTVSVNTNQ